MSNIRGAIRSLVLADSGVSNLIGTRMHIDKLPQDWTSPAIRYSVISSPREHNLTGPVGRADRRIQIDCYSLSSKSEAVDVAEAVREAIDGVRTTQDGVKIGRIRTDEERDGFEDVETEDVHRVSLDFMVAHNETP